ncbi:hypothetical protein BHF71_04025 [Vulcanibacillus modesticaldus]|uniref:DUF1850 domain-containing protein n=1 Tax=Vulcanibacillus modesticaldus TaxID=337097 RepID=A0A1D2YS54_9BACI|nr:DUF1850 domain-containing protein [Vulcanibacillus modesticaldus]OEF96903.1 hypothetical protein BHF71_04025 [Vulcanibacillus modesticaldus]
MSTGNGAHYLNIIISIILIFVIITIYLSNNYVVFQIRKYETGEIVFKKVLKIDETFTLEYIHSVTAQPVFEVFFVKDKNTLALKEMRYDSFGANLPVGPEKLRNEETKFIPEDGYYKILYEDRSFDKVPLRVGQVIADHTLVFADGERIRFLSLVTGGEYVEFYVLPLLKALVKG